MRPWSEKPGLGDDRTNPDDFWFVLVHEAPTWPTRRRWLWTKRVPGGAAAPNAASARPDVEPQSSGSSAN